MHKKKLAIIGTNGLPANYGGFETLTNYLVEYLADRFDITVFCKKTPKNERIDTYNGAKLKYLPLSANGVESILYDITSIMYSYIKFDILLILGASGTIILPLNFFFRKKIVFNFGGLEWKREKWGRTAKYFLKISEYFGIKFANNVVVDNAVFQEYVKNKYHKNSVLIEYGGDHVKKTPPKTDILRNYGLLGKNYFLSVSRAQEDNNLHVLLEAFKNIPDKNLAIISNWSISEYGMNLKKVYSDCKNLYLIDAIYNQDELDNIRSNAYCYIHSHSACGSAPSLIEAMSLGLPIISFDVPTNRATTEGTALFFGNQEELKDIIVHLTEEKIKMLEQASLSISYRRYKWKIIAGKYQACMNNNN